MSRLVRAALLTFALSALGACAALLAQFGIHPATDRIKVPHEKHQKAQVDCATCHETVYDAEALGGDFLPREKTCMQCHKDQKEAGNCAMCHTEANEPRSYIGHDVNLKMSHAKHIERVKEDCSVCHKALPSPSRPESAIVEMDACLSCHEHKEQYDQGKCDTCHEDLSRIGLKPVSLFSHRGNFVKEHAAAARSSAQACATCHEQTFCTQCHNTTAAMPIEQLRPERVEQRFIHRNDFVSRHAVEARADQALCQRCHGTEFCQSCHRAQNLTPQGTNPRNPHPVDWAFAGNKNGHGRAARSDISSCAGCHDQGAASICINCHRSGGPGGDPHPPGWANQHPLKEVKNNPMCRACH